MRQLYLSGNAYAYCRRNDRYEIDEIHLMDNRYCRALIDGSGEVFYTLAGNWVVQNRYGPMDPVPQRDVLHIKLHCDQLRNPLLGQTPLAAAYLDTMTGETIRQQQMQFYSRVSKPGFVLTTDLTFDKDQVSALRDRWTEQTTGANVGGTPILTGGLKPVAVPAISNWRDAQLAEMLRLTDQDIAMAFRCPPQVIGLETRGGSYGSAEALMTSWISSGLGFALNHVEEAFGLTFALDGEPDEYVEFDTKALLRSAFKDQHRGPRASNTGRHLFAQRSAQRRRFGFSTVRRRASSSAAGGSPESGRKNTSVSRAVACAPGTIKQAGGTARGQRRCNKSRCKTHAQQSTTTPMGAAAPHCLT